MPHFFRVWFWLPPGFQSSSEGSLIQDRPFSCGQLRRNVVFFSIGFHKRNPRQPSKFSLSNNSCSELRPDSPWTSDYCNPRRQHNNLMLCLFLRSSCLPAEELAWGGVIILSLIQLCWSKDWFRFCRHPSLLTLQRRAPRGHPHSCHTGICGLKFSSQKSLTCFASMLPIY